jgi:hypothetical protein
LTNSKFVLIRNNSVRTIGDEVTCKKCAQSDNSTVHGHSACGMNTRAVKRVESSPLESSQVKHVVKLKTRQVSDVSDVLENAEEDGSDVNEQSKQSYCESVQQDSKRAVKKSGEKLTSDATVCSDIVLELNVDGNTRRKKQVGGVDIDIEVSAKRLKSTSTGKIGKVNARASDMKCDDTLLPLDDGTQINATVQTVPLSKRSRRQMVRKIVIPTGILGAKTAVLKKQIDAGKFSKNEPKEELLGIASTATESSEQTVVTTNSEISENEVGMIESTVRSQENCIMGSTSPAIADGLTDSDRDAVLEDSNMHNNNLESMLVTASVTNCVVTSDVDVNEASKYSTAVAESNTKLETLSMVPAELDTTLSTESAIGEGVTKESVCCIVSSGAMVGNTMCSVETEVPAALSEVSSVNIVTSQAEVCVLDYTANSTQTQSTMDSDSQDLTATSELGTDKHDSSNNTGDCITGGIEVDHCIDTQQDLQSECVGGDTVDQSQNVGKTDCNVAADCPESVCTKRSTETLSGCVAVGYEQQQASLSSIVYTAIEIAPNDSDRCEAKASAVVASTSVHCSNATAADIGNGNAELLKEPWEASASSVIGDAKLREPGSGIDGEKLLEVNDNIGTDINKDKVLPAGTDDVDSRGSGVLNTACSSDLEDGSKLDPSDLVMCLSPESASSHSLYNGSCSDRDTDTIMSLGQGITDITGDAAANSPLTLTTADGLVKKIKSKKARLFAQQFAMGLLPFEYHNNYKKGMCGCLFLYPTCLLV